MLTADRVCCPECGHRVGYLPTGLTERHDVDDRVECPAGWPPYVSPPAGDDALRPTPLHALLDAPPPVLPPAYATPAAPYSRLKAATLSWQPW